MTYSYRTSFGGGVILAPCLATLCAEIAAHPDYRNLTNLGELGDVAHQGQGYGSDHNPFIRHAGRSYVRAIDLGGDHGLLLRLRGYLHDLYVRHDPRVYPFGYFKGPDSLINDWFGGGWHVDTGDEGHLHISVTQLDGYNPSPGGWVPALDSRAPWGISSTLTNPLEFTVQPDDRKYFDAKFSDVTHQNNVVAAAAASAAHETQALRGEVAAMRAAVATIKAGAR